MGKNQQRNIILKRAKWRNSCEEWKKKNCDEKSFVMKKVLEVKIYNISRFILPLLNKGQVKLLKFNSDFSNYFFVSCLKLSA